LYEKQQALLELYQKLAEAEAQSAAHLPRTTHKDLIGKLRAKINV
jgi:hypothetical protein